MKFKMINGFRILFCGALFSVLIGCAATLPHGEKSKVPDHRYTGPSNNPYYYFLESQFYKKNGDLDTALTYLKKAVELDPTSSYLKLEVSMVLLGKNDFPHAIQTIQELLKQDPDTFEAHILQGGVKQYQKENEAAIEAYEKVIQLDPDRKNMYLILGSLYMEQGEEEKAKVLYNKMISHFPDSYTGYFFLGKIHLLQKDAAGAEKNFKKTIEIEPKLLEPRFELLDIYKEREASIPKGKATARKKQSEAILGIFKDILKIDPDNIRARMEFGLYYHNAGMHKKASDIFSDLAERSDKDQSILRNILFLYIDQKKYSDAVVILNGMLKFRKDNSELQHFIGVAYNGMKKYDKAIEHFLKVKEDSKFYENAVIHTAYLYQTQKQVPKAIKLLEHAIEKMPDNTEFFLYLGAFYEELGEYEKAEKILKKGLTIDENYTRLHFRLGVLYDKWGKKEKSIKEMKTVIAIDPEDAHALNYLGYTYLDLNKNLDEAEELIRKAMDLAPEDGYITDSLGWLFYKKGQYPEAVKKLEKAVQLVPEDPIILEHLGDAYMSVNQKDKALIYYKRALKNKNKDRTQLEQKLKDLEESLQNK